MFLRKLSVFAIVGILLFLQNAYSNSVFQTMAITITNQLFPLGQQIATSDQHLRQLFRSVCSQLQSTMQTKDIKNVIDVILNVFEQKQNYSEEIGVLLVVIVCSHVLRIVAQKLYRSISLVRKSILYWKKIDQLSPLQYYLTHVPTLWSLKFKGDFQIKEKITKAEKIYAGYIAQLGSIVRLIHQLPRTLHSNTNIVWINNALFILKKHIEEAIVVPEMKPFHAIALLKYIKLFLEHFDQEFNIEFQHVRNAVSFPSYFSQNFGKIMAYAVGIGIFLFSSYDYSDKIKIWITNAKNNVKNYVWDPIRDNVKAIFSMQEKDLDQKINELKGKIFQERSNQQNGLSVSPPGFNLEQQEKILTDLLNQKNLLLDEQKVKESIQIFENLAEKFKQKSIARKPTEGDNTALLGAIKVIFQPNGIQEEEIKRIVETTDWMEVFRQSRKLPKSIDYEANSLLINKEKVNDLINKLNNEIDTIPITLELVLYEMVPLVYELLYAGSGLLADVMRALHKIDKDNVLLRKLLILTPALFMVVGTYKIGSGIYNYMTQKDYANLKIALKELETVSICAMDQPKSDSSYGLFIFLLETLKIGVVQTVSSRYTKRNELLEDLKRLESLELTFEQRLRLIEQIQKSYFIFNQS